VLSSSSVENVAAAHDQLFPQIWQFGIASEVVPLHPEPQF